MQRVPVGVVRLTLVVIAARRLSCARAQGLATYFFASVGLGVALLLLGLGLVFFRYFCCCSPRRGRCKCGARFPTRRGVLLGYISNDLTGSKYPRRARVGTFVLVAAFVCLLL